MELPRRLMADVYLLRDHGPPPPRKGVMPGKVAEPHAKVEESCFDCHAALGKAFRAKCVACHKKDDEHKGRFGTKCERCHTDQTWERKDFDHRKETGYALDGAHRKVEVRLLPLQAALHDQDANTVRLLPPRRRRPRRRLGTSLRPLPLGLRVRS